MEESNHGGRNDMTIDSKIERVTKSLEIKRRNVEKCEAHVDKLKMQLAVMTNNLTELAEAKKNPPPTKPKAEKKGKAKKSPIPTATGKEIELFRGASIFEQEDFHVTMKRLNRNAGKLGFLVTTTDEGLVGNAIRVKIEKAFGDHEFQVDYITKYRKLYLIEKVWFKGQRVQIWNQAHGQINQVDVVPDIPKVIAK